MPKGKAKNDTENVRGRTKKQEDERDQGKDERGECKGGGEREREKKPREAVGTPSNRHV